MGSSCCSSPSSSLLMALVWMVGGVLLAVTWASLSSDIGFTLFQLKENLETFLQELEGGFKKYPVTDNRTVSTAREMIQALPKARGHVLAVGAVYSASLALEALLLVLGLRCGEKRLLLPFLFHSLLDILLVLAAGGSLAAGLFLSSGVVTGVMMAPGGVPPWHGSSTCTSTQARFPLTPFQPARKRHFGKKGTD